MNETVPKLFIGKYCFMKAQRLMYEANIIPIDESALVPDGKTLPSSFVANQRGRKKANRIFSRGKC